MAAAAGLLTACSPSDDTGGAQRASRSARAERALRLRSAATSRTLLGQYDAVLARHPEQRTRLTPLRSAVAQHVTALAPLPLSASSSAPAPRQSVTAAAPGGGPAGAVSEDPAQAVRALAGAERRTSEAHTAALLDAPPELARLLASVAAAGAGHAFLLTERGRS
jgi:hypothetical protein